MAKHRPECFFTLARGFSPTTLKWSPRSLSVIVFFNPSYELVPFLQHYSGLFNKSTTIFHGLKIVVDLFFYTKIESFDVHFLYSCSENRVSEKDKNKLHHQAISMVCTLMKHIALDQSVSFVREIA